MVLIILSLQCETQGLSITLKIFIFLLLCLTIINVSHVIQQQIPPYPSQEELQQRQVDQANWNFYKSQTLNDILQI